ncbi:MAG: outer membrane beta-barrel protein [Ferruginibacter sp.]
MENEFYTDDFELLIKEKADQFRMYPSKRVWHSIYNNLHPGRRWPSFAMGLLLIASLMLIGYLNTGDNSLTQPINNSYIKPVSKTNALTSNNKNDKVHASPNLKIQQPVAVTAYADAFADVITNETDFYIYTIVRNNRPANFYNTSPVGNEQLIASNNSVSEKDLIQRVDMYIKTNQIFTDISASAKKNKPEPAKTKMNNSVSDKTIALNEDQARLAKSKINVTDPVASGKITEADKSNNEETKLPVKINTAATDKVLTPAEKAWIENYAFENKSTRKNKWKNRLAYQFYITPAVNYRKLTTETKGSISPFAYGDINNAISQKPGIGIESGLGLTYSVTNKLYLKVGAQFNYTNYNIDADKTTHPIQTSILLNDPSTGYSYSASRSSNAANKFDGSAAQPVTLHNRTYQISIPVGVAYKLSSQNNVDWFAGATVQPTYIFGGNAHLISSDLRNYISDPSSIRNWNLNLGFETYMNFKMGAYNFQVGPQVRYQVFSTYRKNVALIEKPYAIGLKFGLTKGF